MAQQIRNYETGDIDAIMAIVEAEDKLSMCFLSEQGLINSKDGIRSQVISSTNKTLVLEQDGKVIGFACFHDKEKNQDDSILIALYVSSEKQNQGHGKSLFKEVALLSEKNKIVLAVYKKNEKAYNFYIKRGFLTIKEGDQDGHRYFEMEVDKTTLLENCK